MSGVDRGAQLVVGVLFFAYLEGVHGAAWRRSIGAGAALVACGATAGACNALLGLDAGFLAETIGDTGVADARAVERTDAGADVAADGGATESGSAPLVALHASPNLWAALLCLGDASGPFPEATVFPFAVGAGTDGPFRMGSFADVPIAPDDSRDYYLYAHAAGASNPTTPPRCSDATLSSGWVRLGSISAAARDAQANAIVAVVGCRPDPTRTSARCGEGFEPSLGNLGLSVVALPTAVAPPGSTVLRLLLLAPGLDGLADGGERGAVAALELHETDGGVALLRFEAEPLRYRTAGAALAPEAGIAVATRQLSDAAVVLYTPSAWPRSAASPSDAPAFRFPLGSVDGAGDCLADGAVCALFAVGDPDETDILGSRWAPRIVAYRRP